MKSYWKSLNDRNDPDHGAAARSAGFPIQDIVEIDFQVYRRLSIPYPPNAPVTWQQKTHTDEFHTIFNGQFTIKLESKFQLDVPAATPEQIRV